MIVVRVAANLQTTTICDSKLTGNKFAEREREMTIKTIEMFECRVASLLRPVSYLELFRSARSYSELFGSAQSCPELENLGERCSIEMKA